MTGPEPVNPPEPPDPGRVLVRLRETVAAWRRAAEDSPAELCAVGDEMAAHVVELDGALVAGSALPPEWAHAPAPVDPNPVDPPEEVAAARRVVTAALADLDVAATAAAGAAAQRRAKARALGEARRVLHDVARLNDLSRP